MSYSLSVSANPWRPHWDVETNFKHPVDLKKYPDPNFIEFIGDEVLYNVKCTCFGEREQNLAKMFMEAHKKFNFTPGTIYMHNGDSYPVLKPEVKNTTIYHSVFDIRLKEQYYNYAGPDFSALSWGSAQIRNYDEETKAVIESSKKKPILDKMGWVGNRNNHAKRDILMKIGEQHTDIFNFTHFINDLFNTNSPSYVTHHQLTEYFAYLIDVEGVGYSARLKYMMFSNRPLFLVHRNYVVYFEVELHPFVHYIPVRGDMSDLVEKYKWAVEHPERARQIAQNAFDYAMANLTHEVSCDTLIHYVAYHVQLFVSVCVSSWCAA